MCFNRHSPPRASDAGGRIGGASSDLGSHDRLHSSRPDTIDCTYTLPGRIVEASSDLADLPLSSARHGWKLFSNPTQFPAIGSFYERPPMFSASVLLDTLSTLAEDILNKDVIYSVILVLSGILMDKNGQEAVVENAHIIVNQLIELALYPHMMVIRETAIQCLVAVSELPHARIYPLRTKVLRAISKSRDDPKRAVRQAAVRCRQAWASIGSRSLHF